MLKPFTGRAATLHAVPVPGHEHHAPDRLVAVARETGMTARAAAAGTTPLDWIARHADRGAPPAVLILGSLYLAGAVLDANDQPPG